MVYYYTIRIKKPETINSEQQKVLIDFTSRYKARIVGAQTLVLDFQSSTKLVPADLKKQLNGLEVLSVSE